MSSPSVAPASLAQPVSPLDRWALDPAVVHLNHGSYGGCPRSVLAAAATWRARLEAAPMKFMVLDWQPALDAARAELAAFVHAPADRLVFVPSSTTGVAIALGSAGLAAGDDIVTIDQAYRACMNQLKRLAAARGATITVVPVPMPFDAGALIDAVGRAITPRTRLALFDHIISPTALRLPIEALVGLCAARGIPVVVDGAHAPGQIPLDVAAIGATWYVGNCHKWLCAPKGSGFLVVGEGAPAHPVVTSHGASPEYGPPNRLHAELDWAGTHDPSAHLAVPAAIAAVAAEGGGWPAIYQRNHALACELHRRLTDGLGAPPLAPDDALGCMAAIPIRLPAGMTPGALQDQVLRDGWEIPIVEFPTGPLIRVSAHLYNHAGEADQLAAKLHALGVRIGR
ncbi:MAG TPA: aminotransferase class V-fold PLP-dependent enzyme [Kofleriaceae bacterium]|nr:aminotransferase class V-fold PLP-dependent enzyme [Kofleriaceae bacterium]